MEAGHFQIRSPLNKGCIRSTLMRHSSEVKNSINTPDSMETSMSTLVFFDGVPTNKTVQRVSDNLDWMCGFEFFLNCMPDASILGLLSEAVFYR